MVAAIETLFAQPRKTRRPALDEQIQTLRVLLEKADREFFDACAREYRRTREAVMIGYVYYPAWLWPRLEQGEGDIVEAGWGYSKENVLRRLRGQPVRIFAPGPVGIPPEARQAIAVAERATVYPRQSIDLYTATRIPPLKYDVEIRRRLLARDIVTQGIGRGEGVRGISASLEFDGFGRSAWHREVIARTETAVLFEHGKMAEYVASPSVLGFRFDAVIDNRTTEICEYMDGREFRVEDANGVEPPLHFACRSTTEPIFIFDEQPEWQRADAVLDGASDAETPLRGFGGVDYSTMPPQGTPADLYRALNASESAVARQYAAELEARLMQIRRAVPKVPVKGVQPARGIRPMAIDEMDWQENKWNNVLDKTNEVEHAGITKGHISDKLSEQLLDNKDWQRSLLDKYALRDNEGHLPTWAEWQTQVGSKTIERHSHTLVDSYVKEWAETSGDGSPRAVAMQLAIKDEFKLQRAAFGHLELSGSPLEEATALYAREGAGMRAFARGTYNHTQALLAEQGVDDVILYRGVRWEAGQAIPSELQALSGSKAGLVQTVTQPATSFSTNISAARYFSGQEGYIITTRVPAKSIFSTCQTGLGCKAEAEMVILGGEQSAIAAPIKSFEQYMSFAEERAAIREAIVEASKAAL